MRLIIVGLVAVLLPISLSVAAQQPSKCNLGIADAPAIRGVRLGMTSSEVLDMLRADFPVRRSYHGYLTSNLKFSAYFRDKYASNDSILLSMLRELQIGRAHV